MANVVVVVFLVLAATLTLQGSTLMLTVLNLTYYLLGQLVPGWMAILFFKRVKSWAVSTGIIAGIIASLALYNAKPDFGGVNAGLVAMGINVVLTFGLSLLGERVSILPMAAWHPRDHVEAEAQTAPSAGVGVPQTDGQPLPAPGQG